MEDFTELSALLGRRFLYGEPLSKHTTFHIGGPAEALCLVASPGEVVSCAEYCAHRNIPVTLIGNGSNLLVRDGGISGLVMKVSDSMSEIEIDSQAHTMTVQAGAHLANVSLRASHAGLCGLEFAGGIPGTLGGAIAMNAGAYGGEMSQIVTAVTVMTQDCKVLTLKNADMDFSYRRSRVQTERLAVLSATLQLCEGDIDESLQKIKNYNRQRREKQPLNYYSAGSTFKRPEGHFAARIIEEAGLKGLRVGDAQVSELHSGFIINIGSATASDVLKLIDIIKATVYKKFNVQLEPEIHIIGNP